MRSTVVAPLALIALVAACTAPSTGSGTASAEPTDADVTQSSTGDAATQEPTGAPGSRDKPFPAGTELTFADDEGQEVAIVVGPADWDAGDLVAAENEYNAPAPAGTAYVLVPVTITNVHTDAPVWTYLIVASLTYVAPDGLTIPRAAQPAVPDDLRDLDGPVEGDSVTGNVAFAIPSEARGGAWAVRWSWDGWTYTDPVFVEAT